MSDRDSRWTERIQKGDEQAFEELFRAHYSELCGFAADYLSSVDRARDVVQDTFLEIWRRRGDIKIKSSIKSYLYQSVRNRALNEIRKSKTKSEYLEAVKSETEGREKRTAINKIEMSKLSDEVNEAISELPERRRMAFLLHRRHGFTYKEVAQIMGIAPKTVENQIGRALKSLRSQLEGLFAEELHR
jgi:RNA polymerase sigma-70 factor (ECF subfamily)